MCIHQTAGKADEQAKEASLRKRMSTNRYGPMVEYSEDDEENGDMDVNMVFIGQEDLL